MQVKEDANGGAALSGKLVGADVGVAVERRSHIARVTERRRVVREKVA